MLKMQVGVLLILVSAQATSPAYGRKPLPVDAKPFYGVCDIRSSRELSKVGATRQISVRGRLGRSYHFGVILTDDRCPGSLIRVITPVPDPSGLSTEFRFLDAQGHIDGSANCKCSGRLSYQNAVPELYVSNAVIERVLH